MCRAAGRGARLQVARVLHRLRARGAPGHLGNASDADVPLVRGAKALEARVWTGAERCVRVFLYYSSFEATPRVPRVSLSDEVSPLSHASIPDQTDSGFGFAAMVESNPGYLESCFFLYLKYTMCATPFQFVVAQQELFTKKTLFVATYVSKYASAGQVSTPSRAL